MVFSVRVFNQPSSRKTEDTGMSIFCPMCRSHSKVVTRRNIKYICVCTVQMAGIKKYKAYPACGVCLNELPERINKCPVCKSVLTLKSLFCRECGHTSTGASTGARTE